MKLFGLTDSVASVTGTQDKCRQCGDTSRLGNGLCLSCTLREGLEGDREASRESFEAILAEDEVRDTHWRVGNYEILEEIGRGGMGVIYRARQRHSRRIVALKRMVSYHADSGETLERFRREAEAAASLDHPNILPIYEVGQGEDGLPFFSMKYAAGGSLQKAERALRGEPRECVRLMAKVARAVQYAHEHGVLHRDLKPGNILLDGRGEPFVTDFGLAKWLDTATDLTRTLAIFGTPGYIAPEQAIGPAAKLTPAADVYSLGAILYDLFTGRPPFLGEHALAVIQQASEKSAPKLRSIAPALDRDLETICARCLEREPQARYRSAGDLAIDLERWLEGRPIIARRVSPAVRTWRWLKRNPKLATATVTGCCFAAAAAILFVSYYRTSPQSGLDSRVPSEKSIAVLPFENLSRDPDNAYFAEGIQDEILTRLAKVADLKVISHTSTQRYKSSPDNLPQIAKELGVANILEGSVQKSQDQVRVNVQLINAATDAHLWGDSFDRKLIDIFAVESEIAAKVADILKAKLTGAEQHAISMQPTRNTEAYQLYLKGRYFWNKRTGPDLQKAIDYFKQAIEKDPSYALAYVGLGDSYILLSGFGAARPQDSFPLAEAAAKKALAIDDNLAEAHTTLGFSLCVHHLDFAGSIREFERAIALNPNYATAHHWFGDGPLLAVGQFDRAIAEGKRAVELDPLSVIITADLGADFLVARRYDEAIDQFHKAIDLDSRFYYAHWNLAQALEMKGNLREALAEYKKAVELDDDPFVLALLGQAYAKLGQRDEALTILARLRQIGEHRYIASYSYALLYMALGEKDEAIGWLERSYQEGAGLDVIFLKVDPMLDPLQKEPRFQALVAKVFAANQ